MDIGSKIKHIREKNDLSQIQLGNELGVAQKVISNWESGRNDPPISALKTFIEKYSVSPAWLLSGDNNQLFDGRIEFLCLKAQMLAIDSGSKDELINLIQKFIDFKSASQQAIDKLKTVKGKDFISKLAEGWTGKGERMLIVLYYFLQHLADQKIVISPTMKTDFLAALENFNVPKKMFTMNESDKKRLIEWVLENLTEVEIIDILSSTAAMSEILGNIKDELNIVNKLTV